MLKKLINTPSSNQTPYQDQDSASSDSESEEDTTQKQSRKKKFKKVKKAENSSTKKVQNYQNIESNRDLMSLKSSPINFMKSTQRSNISPKKYSSKKPTGNLNSDLDFDLDKQLVDALKKHEYEKKEEEDKRLKKVLEKAPKLTNKSIQAI